jgi:hypothetical protein
LCKGTPYKEKFDFTYFSYIWSLFLPNVSISWIFSDFYNIKPPRVGDLGTVIKKFILFHFDHEFKVFSARILS